MSYEEQREESIKFLIENGINVNVTGDGWDKGKYFEIIKDYYAGPSVYGEAYVDKINAMPTLNTFNANDGITSGIKCFIATIDAPKKKLPSKAAICAFVVSFIWYKIMKLIIDLLY